MQLLLVLTVQKSLTQTGATTNHLPELCLTHNLLEEHQIDYLGNVDTRIHHINRYYNLGQLLGIRELINQTLCVVGVVINDPAEVGRIVGVFFTENAVNLLGVLTMCRFQQCLMP